MQSREVDSLAELLSEYWHVLTSAVFLIVWLIRLESRSISNEKEIKRLGEKQEKDLNKIDAGITVIQADIKKLLERH